MPKIPTEAQEQIWLIEWSQQPSIRKMFPELKLLYHIPNERSDKIQAAILKKMGVKKGVPDLLLPVARGKHHGLYIEMKRLEDGRVSEDQKWWIKELDSQGYAVGVAYGWRNAVKLLEWYFGLGEFHCD